MASTYSAARPANPTAWLPGGMSIRKSLCPPRPPNIWDVRLLVWMRIESMESPQRPDRLVMYSSESRRKTALWPPGPHALAWAAAKAAEAVLGRSRRTLSGFIAPDDSNGRRERTAALPLRLGEAGVLSDKLPTLSVHDRVAFDNAVML